MRKLCCALVLLLASFGSMRSQQYYYYLYTSDYDRPYVFDVFGSSSFIIARPAESAASVRMMGFPSGFTGLIADPYSDWFRNPSANVNARPTELYGLGSVAGMFSVGAIKQSEALTVGVFPFATSLNNSTSSSNFNNLNLSGPLSTNTSSYTYETSSNLWGGVALCRFQISDEAALGLSYQIQTEQFNGKESSKETATLPTVNRLRRNELERSETRHTIGVGFSQQFSKANFALRGRVAFSSPTLSNSRLETYSSQSSMNKTENSNPLNVSTTGVLVGAEYTYAPSDSWRVRSLVEAAYTKYEGSGTTKYLNASGDSVFRNTNESVWLPKNDGSIIDVNIGTAFEKSVRQLTLYGGAVFNFARNKSEQSNNGTNIYRFGTQQPVTTTFAQTYAATVNWWFVRLPLGAEYAFTKGLAFRGGIMPEYLSTTTENSSERTQSSTQGTVDKTTNESTTKNLRFTATLGASLYDDELGEMHASYGTTRGMGNSWSVSLRFYP